MKFTVHTDPTSLDAEQEALIQAQARTQHETIIAFSFHIQRGEAQELVNELITYFNLQVQP